MLKKIVIVRPELCVGCMQCMIRCAQAHSRGKDLARAIAFVAETPRGAHIVDLEVQPEAPLRDTAEDRQHLQLGEEGMPQS